MPCGRWKAVDELTTDRADLGLQPRLVHRLRGRVHALNLDLLGAGEGLAAQGPLLEGSATFEVGDQTIEASAGDYLFGPRDIPHRYTVGPEGCRMLFICTPAGFENLVLEMSEPAGARTLPPAPEPPDFDEVAPIAREGGCELLA